MEKCKVSGCHHKLDFMGVPIEYCDYQQGRCPMQKKPELSTKAQVFMTLSILVFVCIVIAIVK